LKDHLKSAALVSLQFILIGCLLFTTARWALSFIAISFIIVGITLVIWAIVTMQKSKLRISPVPAADAILVDTGPYKYLRHPMYTAILMTATAILFIDFTWPRFAMALALTIVLIIKLFWEEAMLTRKFPSYTAYCKHTKRIIPFIF
jgi:protein-S-isoprenylcysteine O-methyltransferase Ste14